MKSILAAGVAAAAAMSVTGRLSNHEPEMQPQPDARLPDGTCIDWKTAAHVDYSELEARVVLAHYGAPAEGSPGQWPPKIPDRVNIDPGEHYWPLYKLLGVKIDGEDRPGDVHEFCVSEGWAVVHKRGPNGKFAIDPENSQRFALERIQGKIEPYYRRQPDPPRGSTSADEARLKAAEEKRARKAAKLKGQNNG